MKRENVLQQTQELKKDEAADKCFEEEDQLTESKETNFLQLHWEQITSSGVPNRTKLNR